MFWQLKMYDFESFFSLFVRSRCERLSKVFFFANFSSFKYHPPVTLDFNFCLTLKHFEQIFFPLLYLSLPPTPMNAQIIPSTFFSNVSPTLPPRKHLFLGFFLYLFNQLDNFNFLMRRRLETRRKFLRRF